MHHSCHVVAYLSSHVAKFVEPENRSLSSPYLSLFDFLVHEDLQQRACCQKIGDIDPLKHVLFGWWDQISRECNESTVDLLLQRVTMMLNSVLTVRCS